MDDNTVELPPSLLLFRRAQEEIGRLKTENERLSKHVAAGAALYDLVQEIAARATTPTLIQHALEKALTAYRIETQDASEPDAH